MSYAVYHADAVQVKDGFDTLGEAREWIRENKHNTFNRDLQLTACEDHSRHDDEQSTFYDWQLNNEIDALLGK